MAVHYQLLGTLLPRFKMIKCIVLIIVLLVAANGHSSSLGKDFRLVFMENFVDYPVHRDVDIHVCNAGSSSALVSITLPYFEHDDCPAVTNLTVPDKSCQVATLCKEIRHTYADGSLSSKLVDVISTENISVYGLNPEKFSTDLFVVLPWAQVGMTYYVLTYSPQHIQTQFSIVTKMSTVIRIAIPDWREGAITVDYNGIRYSNGDSFRFRLDPTTSFLAQSSGDLTGVLIQSSHSVAVFTGNVRTYVNYRRRSRDHLVEQMLPTAKWGMDYIYVPTPRSTIGDYIRIIAGWADNTEINLTTKFGVENVTISEQGQFLEIERDVLTHICANNPILVAVIVRSQNGKEAGQSDPNDPSMYFLPSVDQFSPSWLLPVFHDSENIPYQKVWLLVVMQDDEIQNFLIDDQHPDDSAFVSLSDGLPYAAGVFQIESSVQHIINNSGGDKMVIVYGASDRESFASALGYYFTDNQCLESVMVEADGIDNDCDGFVDEEACDNTDNDNDKLVDEDCYSGPVGERGSDHGTGIGGNPGGEIGWDPDSGIGSNPGSETGSDSGNGTGSNPDGGTGGDSGSGTGGSPDSGTGGSPGSPGSGTGGSPDGGTGSDPDGGTGSDPDGGTGSDPDGGTGGTPDSGTGDNPGSRTGGEPSGSPVFGGTEYTICFQTNIVTDAPVTIDEIELYFAGIEPETYVSVTTPAYEQLGETRVQAFPITEDSTVIQLSLNTTLRTGNDAADLGVSSITPKGIKVSGNKKFVLYGINKKQFSTDGFLALPNSVIGSHYYAFCSFPIETDDDRCQFAAVATVDNTRVFVTLRAGVTTEPFVGTSAIYTGPTTFDVMLNAFEVLEIQSRDDLSGTYVYSEDGTRFSFFSGNIRARLPLKAGSRDHLVEQLPPVPTWGMTFRAIPTPRVKKIGDVFKVIASQADTDVTYWYFNQTQQVESQFQNLSTSGAHFTIDLGFESAITISASRPVLVFQISKSATERDTDPAAIILPPENMWASTYRFVTPLSGQLCTDEDVSNSVCSVTKKQLPFQNNVLIAVRKEDREGIKYIDGVGETFYLGNLSGWIDIPGSGPPVEGFLYDIPYIGQDCLVHTDSSATFMAIIFGKIDRETYGNAVGLRLEQRVTPAFNDPMSPLDDPIIDNCIAVEQVEDDGVDNDCDGVADEEPCNNIDDDGDGKIDEDCSGIPSGHMYYLVFQENLVDYPRNFALEIYVGNSNSDTALCHLQTPSVHASPYYDNVVVIPSQSAQALAVSSHLRVGGTGLSWNSITVECDLPVSVMGMNKETFSADAFIAFERNTLGKEYYTVHFGKPTIQTQLAVLAVEDGMTNVTMNFSAPIRGNGKDNLTFTSLTLQLHQNEIYQAQSYQDLTGSKISADKAVAVFSGNIRTRVVLSGSRDHLASQLPPTDSWGTDFNIVPLFTRTVGDLIRVIARDSFTQIAYQNTMRVLHAGWWMEIDVNSTDAFRLRSTRPVLLMQIVKSQSSAEADEEADPCFIFVPPINQYVTQTTLVTPLYTAGYYESQHSYRNYLTMIVPAGSSDGIRLNGDVVSSVQTRDIKKSSYEAVDFTLNIGGVRAYTLTHVNTSVQFSGYLAGFADRESYCVSVGPNLPVLFDL